MVDIKHRYTGKVIYAHDGANLYGADLRGADLRGANLRGANLYGADLPPFQIVPSEDSFIAWKKVRGAVLKIKIPAAAQRTSSLIGRKCRASCIEVLEAVGTSDTVFKNSTHNIKTEYVVGEVTHADKFDDDVRVECTNGIHFFMTRKEAEQW